MLDQIIKVSTGMAGLDQVIDKLRIGDNVVWQVDSVNDYKQIAIPFAEQALSDHSKLVYVRFGKHEPLLTANAKIKVYELDAKLGFESFAAEVHQLMDQEGERTFYIFDCLTDLLDEWHSDLMIGNFFEVACPYLFDLNTIAYFSLLRNAHTNSTVARIRETTQLLLDVYKVRGKLCIHPLKVWKRYSPTMFFPHWIRGQEAKSITASTEAAELFSTIYREVERLDHWNVILHRARAALGHGEEEQLLIKKQLMSMMIGSSDSRIFQLCERYFELHDILAIASRMVGTGFIGGKSVGMLLARKILEQQGDERFVVHMEAHDSFYLGSDLFYTYIVQNGWWKLRMQQRAEAGCEQLAANLKEKLLAGRFPDHVQEQFVRMLEYYGQSPIIVRSSSLLEDNFGNAFAGKYESVFCVNQGTPEERYKAFEQAIRTVYASTMNEDALAYRQQRGLLDQDEQMAILVQRVSGDHYDDDFFPHIAGVGNSKNLYVWDESIEMNAGMLRLVLGLGTRAVERTVGDYVKIISLDDPMRLTKMNANDQRKFSQHEVDLLSIHKNVISSKPLEEVLSLDLKVEPSLFVSPISAMNEADSSFSSLPVLDFHKLLKQTAFPQLMREMMSVLSAAYQYPVDIEFTANFTREKQLKINLLQCRPLQTRRLGPAVKVPKLKHNSDCFFSSVGGFMGGNVQLPVDYIVYIQTAAYLQLLERDQYAVARQIGLINRMLKGSSVMLVGPGRWGTSTPSLGVPVHFAELCHMSVICELASSKQGMMPELSYGSHFFQDLVEAGIFYVALFDDRHDAVFNPQYILGHENLLDHLLPDRKTYPQVIHVARTSGIHIYSDIVSQRVLCR